MHHVTSKVSLFKSKKRVEGDCDNLLIELSNRKSAHPAERETVGTRTTKKTHDKILPFVTTYHPAVQNFKQIVMENWSFIQNQPLLKTIHKTPPIISYKRGKSLQDTLMRVKI